MRNGFFYDTPIGAIGIAEVDGFISHVCFCGEQRVSFRRRNLVGFDVSETPLIQKTAAQLFEYFSGQRTQFCLPLLVNGTDFQRTVWNALQTIPFGETRCYQEVATQICNPKASRAVGMANHRNPLAIVIPCHRVIGRNGCLTGYAGGLPAKQYLLELEKRHA
jgi:methylated-DNA-[protein]-cysteine S-methyltransferase